MKFSSKLTWPFYIILLPVFFVMHGFVSNFYFVSIGSAALLLALYILSSIIIASIIYLFGRNLRQATLVAAFVMIFNFFFGIFHDWLKEISPGSFLTRYSFLSILLLVSVIILYFLTRKKQLARLTSYLNLLFLLLIGIELISLGSELFIKKTNPSFIPTSEFPRIPDSISKPDIYIILLDGYAGYEQLNDLFSYDNKPFFDSLAIRGFQTIRKTNSNYDSSPSSVASTLEMEYLDSSESRSMRKKGHKPAFDHINNNRLVNYLKWNGYEFYNCSIFRVAGQAAPIGGSFVPSNARLIHANTFLSRLEKDVFINIATRFKWKKYMEKSLNAARRDNEKLIHLTKQIAASNTNLPKIIYTHLMMPHHPYYYDENGRIRPFEELSITALSDKHAYLSYLKYANKRILDLVDKIKNSSSRPQVIAVMSDHGFRYFPGEYSKYAFSNLLSVHLPNKNYAGLPDSLSNVNFFRQVLNRSFGLELQMLPNRSEVIDF